MPGSFGVCPPRATQPLRRVLSAAAQVQLDLDKPSDEGKNSVQELS